MFDVWKKLIKVNVYKNMVYYYIQSCWKMLPPNCFTCGMLMSDIELEYEKKLVEIENNASLTPEQKNERKIKLIDSLGLKRYCCRMRLLGYVDKVNIII